MKHLFVKILPLAIVCIVLANLSRCGNKESKAVKSTEESTKEELTVEKYCKIKKEEVDMGMEKYYDAFINKEYSEIKDLYAQYQKDIAAIHSRFTTAMKEMGRFGRDYNSEVREYLMEHPELKWNVTPEQQKFNMRVYQLLMESYASE